MAPTAHRTPARLSLRTRFEDAWSEARVYRPEYVSRNVFVAEEAIGVDGGQQLPEGFESRVEQGQVVWSQTMRLCPMRATSITNHDAFEALEQGAIRNIEAIRPAPLSMQCTREVLLLCDERAIRMERTG